ncbi:MAG TPA: acryloyl-CoA reductase, partial [Steroidobacteraceae bacterium]
MDRAFRAFRIHSEGGRPVARFEQISLADLSAGTVVIRVTHSGINYKDALAATGAGKILRRYPLVGGIDLAGVVESSEDARYAAGDAVLVTGCALSETHDGGYAQFARVPGDWVIPLPAGLSAFEAMAIGTAGFTAAFAIDRMEQNGQAPQGGPIVVTGASGGVGSIAIDMLSARGYRIIAVSGKAAAAPYLRELGAHEVLARQELDLGSRALETARFGGAIDNLGGEVLTWLTRSVDFWGNIASIGLAAGAELNTTVMPFILRGVSLLGINSSATPRARR